jgi:hypothetical protein
MIHTQFSVPIKNFRSDSGGEYLSNSFRQFLTSEGTLALLMCPGAHTQNGAAERKHRHVIENVRTLLISSFVPSHFLCEAVSTIVCLINRQPSSELSGKTPGEVLFRTPRYDHLRVFGCTCYVLLASCERTKLTVQSMECVFLGYSPEHKGYRCYDPSSHRIRISHYVSFNENRPFFYNSHIHLLFLHSPPLSCAFLPAMLIQLGLHLSLHHRLPHPHLMFSFPLQILLPQHPLHTSLLNHQLPKPTFVVLALVPRLVLMVNPLLMFVLTMMTLQLFLMIYKLLMGHNLLMLPNHQGYHLRDRSTIEPLDPMDFVVLLL